MRKNPTTTTKKISKHYESDSPLWFILIVAMALHSSCTKAFSINSQFQRDTNQTVTKSDEKQSNHVKYKKYKMGRLHVAVWRPQLEETDTPVSAGRAALPQTKTPLIIFSHGSGGRNTQSKFIMESMARAGYLVIAPNHKDATLFGISLRPDFTYPKASRWTEHTFEDRKKDIVVLIDYLHKDPLWNDQIDWSRLVLSGHSLGGYTVLGLAGAWPSWKIDGIKAIVGFSPYSQPFVLHGQLGGLNTPVMYQGGTKDHGITPSIKKDGGAFSQTSSPAYFVEFDHLGHLGWTNFTHNKVKQHLIDYYALYFIDKYGNNNAELGPPPKLEGVTDLEIK